ncbi:MAG: NusG domain II-containing protein [Clostridia bacterium]|nr:NusG domain II-containing protein [Clostridia bacterium]
MKNEFTKKRSLRNDLILILCILMVAAAGLVYLNYFRSPGNMVTVSVDGEIYGMYPLSQDITEDIYSGDNNQNHNRLVISGGEAYMETATCPDGICVAHKSIFRDGESIVCLPNRVVITVTTEDNTDSPDIIV